jgi:UV DNA damage repair endonuclease
LSKWFQTRRFLWEFPIGFYVKLSSAVAAILVGGMKCRTLFWKGTTKGSFQESLVEIGSVVSEEKILLKLHPPFFLFFAWWPSWFEVGITGHIFGREPSNDYFIKMLSLLSKWFQTRRFLWEFPIGSYVKLSSAVVAILVGVLKCRTQFWKRTTQKSFQQSLVEIGSISEEKIFFKFHPPFFLICIIDLNWQKFKAHHYAYTVQIWAHFGLK